MDSSASTEALLAQRLVSLADTVVDDYDVVGLLGRVVQTCLELLPVAQAGLTLLTEAGAAAGGPLRQGGTTA